MKTRCSKTMQVSVWLTSLQEGFKHHCQEEAACGRALSACIKPNREVKQSQKWNTGAKVRGRRCFPIGFCFVTAQSTHELSCLKQYSCLLIHHSSVITHGGFTASWQLWNKVLSWQPKEGIPSHTTDFLSITSRVLTNILTLPHRY